MNAKAEIDEKIRLHLARAAKPAVLNEKQKEECREEIKALLKNAMLCWWLTITPTMTFKH